jgi:hypothetical protein
VSDDSPGYPGAPPDWYPDPAGGPGKRWWDGYAWSDAVVLPEHPAPPTGTTGPAYGAPRAEMHGYGTAGYGTPWYSTTPVGNASALLMDELRLCRLARVAVVVPAIGALLNLINLRIHAAQYRTLGHEYHVMIQAGQNGHKAPALTIPHGFYGGFGVIVSLFNLLTVAAVIVACVWQFRAASTARALGHPAKHSPGWGVGSWFVPVVDFWMPYQALRDCLAPADPSRKLVEQFWMFLLAAWAVTLAAETGALFSSSASLVISLPAALLWIGFIAVAPRVVDAIAAAHQESVGQSPSR